ncbi:MAG: SpoVR family protein [Planctomycetota bacterium]|nr:SpoVR family protein [Planctomycetota bacterium]
MATDCYDSLPLYLSEIQGRMEDYARGYGLDFYPTMFELVDCDQLNEVAAYGGFPTRYPHWRFGMEFEQLTKSYHYGLSKIYELVINNNPCYAYLMKSNALGDQKMVMAHVYGHCDFFKNSYWFSQTSRKMMDEMANHGNRIRRYMDRFGVDEVENFIDCCLSIEDLIDIHSPFIKRRDTPSHRLSTEADPEELPTDGRFVAKGYMDHYVNPPEALRASNERTAPESEKHFPDHPERDVMWFVLNHAPLKPWQLDVLSIVRDEAYYFAPQGQTKIMNEGWASYWHSTIMTRQGLDPGDIVNYADHHSGTMASSPTRLNPYKLGIELFRDIEDRWNRGRYGKEFDECDDYRERQRWDTNTQQGREKIFQVRKVHNDLTFIDEFLTLDFCRQHKLFSFGYDSDNDTYNIESREFPKIKERLLFQLTNMGRPMISVTDGNYKNRGELFLTHQFNGVELKLDYAKDTMMNLERLWRRPVHIETVLDETKTILSFDGHEHKSKEAA